MVFGNCSDPAMCQGLLHWPVLGYGNNQPWVKVRPVRHCSFFLKHAFVSSFFYTAQIHSSLSLKGRKCKVCIFHTQSNLPSDFYYCNIFTGIYICLTDGVQASISICSSFNLWQMKTMKDFGLLRLFSRTGKRIYFIFFLIFIIDWNLKEVCTNTAKEINITVGNLLVSFYWLHYSST